jgi:hypothetical protein
LDTKKNDKCENTQSMGFFASMYKIWKANNICTKKKAKNF